MAKESGRFNGWSNNATWNVALWLGNDEPLYRACQAERTALGRPFTANEARALVLRLMPGGTPDWRDAKRFAEVDWDEIAEALNE
jgi:hypothetical protein